MDTHTRSATLCIFLRNMSVSCQKMVKAKLSTNSLPKFSLKPCQWYADKPVGINLLKKCVKNIAEKGGLTGYFTNHSLRSSCATRMYAAGVDEQLIMETTGHRSECVRSYKKTSAELLQAAQEKLSAFPDMQTSSVQPGPMATSSQGFGEDIVEVQECDWFDQNVLNSAGETVTYKVNEGGKRSRAHKNPCLAQKTTGECVDLCNVLKKVDTKTEAKQKKKRLSLKFKKSS